MKAEKKFAKSDWGKRHDQAIEKVCPTPSRLTRYPMEKALLGLVRYWAYYAESMRKELAWDIGDDAVLGGAWEVMGDGLREMLNGEFGPRLDGGTLDGYILDTMKQYGVDVDQK